MISLAVNDKPALGQQLAERAGVDVFHCYQCKRCTSGCPLAEHMDLSPSQVMRAIQLGQRDRVLHSRTIWLCGSCQTCTSRCPQGLDVARTLDTLRIIAQEEGIPPAVPSVHMFSQSALREIRLFGRLYELGLMAELYARLFFGRLLDLRDFFLGDLPVAVRMFAKGKLKLLPRRVRYGEAPTPEEGEAGAGALAIGYYPGCSLHSTAMDLGLSTRTVAEHLGIRLVEPRGWVCCGTSPAHTTDHLLATSLPMRNLALFQSAGQQCVTMPCASCYERTRTAIYDVQHDPALRAAVERDLGREPADGIEVEHLLETLVKRVGLARIAGRVEQPLEGLKVVCYYGCLLTRPPQVLQQPDPEYPRSMDRLVEALGAEALDWSYKTECCGGSLAFSQQPIMRELCAKILSNAEAVGADAVVVACPLCHANLDLRQNLLSLPQGRIPILYVTELMGLAFGLAPQNLGLDRHITDPMPLLRARSLIA